MSLRTLAKRITPPGAVVALREAGNEYGGVSAPARPCQIARACPEDGAGLGREARPIVVRINDGFNYFVLYKDLFVNGIYHFGAIREES